MAIDSDERLLLICSDTDGDGAERLAGRIVQDAVASLGVRVVAGVAAYPDDGVDISELTLVATRRARSAGCQAASVANGGSVPLFELDARPGGRPRSDCGYGR